jgi:hypothetical protein
MPTAACGISCDVCGLYVKGICQTCAPGTDPRAQEKLDTQIRNIKMHCPILECAVEKKVSYCVGDCDEFPCRKFENGFEAVGYGPYPYSATCLAMFRRRSGKSS